MRPSERRALEAEKKAQKQADQEKEFVAENHSGDRAESGKQEGFFSKHVRIITFSICIVLILTVLGPWSVDRLVSKHRESIFGAEMSDKQDITAKNIVALAERGDALTWSDFEKFNYNDLSYDYRDPTTNTARMPRLSRKCAERM